MQKYVTMQLPLTCKRRQVYFVNEKMLPNANFLLTNGSIKPHQLFHVGIFLLNIIISFYLIDRLGYVLYLILQQINFKQRRASLKSIRFKKAPLPLVSYFPLS